MKCKIIFLDNYYIKITYNNDIRRLYMLFNNNDVLQCESFNRDSFLLKCKNYVKINSNLENVIASV